MNNDTVTVLLLLDLQREVLSLRAENARLQQQLDETRTQHGDERPAGN